jgi:hypothetical protein
MQDDNALTNGHMETESGNLVGQEPSTATVAVEAVDEDAMDTTPDSSQDVVLPNGSADPLEAAAVTSSSPPSNGATQEEPGSNDQPPAAAEDGTAVPSELTVCLKNYNR